MTNQLRSYWLSFPEDPNFPVGFGVTAQCLEEAYELLEACGFSYHREAQRVSVREDVQLADIEYDFVEAQSGPLVVRGVWYPCYNVGFGSV